MIADGGGGIVVTEDGDMNRAVCESVERLYADRAECERMGRDIHKFARADVGARIFREIEALLNRK